MKTAALGIRMHSGWGAMIVLSRHGEGIELLERSRINVAAAEMRGAKQPYHFVEARHITEAERLLSKFTESSERLASAAIGEVVTQVRARDYRLACAAILLASPRALPPLPKILASHALIHTAEGEFFRQIAWKACARALIPVVGYRERELESQAKELFGDSYTRLAQKLMTIGKAAGPPWTLDQKSAAWAALMSFSR